MLCWKIADDNFDTFVLILIVYSPLKNIKYKRSNIGKPEKQFLDISTLYLIIISIIKND